MTVRVRFVCPEVVGSARAGEYTLDEGGTVAGLLEQAAAENGSFVENYMDYLVFLINDKSAKPDAVLHDGDRLTVLRMAYGG